MSRLTKDIREQMARKLVAFRYKEEAKAILYKGRDLFERTYAHLHPAELLAAIEVVKKHSPGSVSLNTQLDVNAGGYQVTVSNSFYSRWVSVEQTKAEDKQTLRYASRYNVTDEKLIQEIKDHSDKKFAFEEGCRTAYHEALSVLNTMTTGKKLAEAWPEAMEVIGDLIPEGERTLPVVQVKEINTKFGLPPKTGAATAQAKARSKRT